MKKAANARSAFFNQLPNESSKRVLLKILFITIVGFILSTLSVIAFLISTHYSPKNPGNWNFLTAIIAQDLPVFLLTLLFFYRKNLKNIFYQLFPKIVNKSAPLMLGVLLLDLLLATSLNLTTFTLSIVNPKQTG